MNAREEIEIQHIEIEDAILQGIKRWLARDEVESIFHSMWLADFDMGYPYSELQEDIAAFGEALWISMGAAVWLLRSGVPFVDGAWGGAVLRLLCERDYEAQS